MENLQMKEVCAEIVPENLTDAKCLKTLLMLTAAEEGSS
jgi:hypothetical protein